MIRMGGRLLLWLLFLVAASGCEERPAMTATAGPRLESARQNTATPFTLPSPYPSRTLSPRQMTATPQMPPTQTPDATADLTQKMIEFRMTIPVLGLDRRLEGSVNGAITVVDETTGVAALLEHQGGVLFELQEALPALELAPLPEDCAGCVAFSYRLPLNDEEDSGWLQDPVMLASIENYMALTLGPHWPEGTVLGLRRSATPYQVAHLIALTAEGDLYRWRAIEAEVEGPTAAGLPPLPERSATLAPEYSAACPAAPVELLYVDRLPAEEEGETAITVICPAFSLPTTLLPLYLELDELLLPLLAEEEREAPAPAIPLATLVAYERLQGGKLFLLYGDRALALDERGELVLETLPAGTVISVTAALQQSEALRPGVRGYAAATASNVLLVRTESGMEEALWPGVPPPDLAEGVTMLEALWAELTGAAGTPTPEGTPVPGETGTPAGTGTPGATPTP